MRRASLFVSSASSTWPGSAVQLVDDPQAGFEAEVAHAAEVEGEQCQHDALRRERLGGGDADLRAGVQIDAAVGLAGDRAADDVADRQRRMALALHLAEGGQRVGRLAALRDGEQQRVGVERRIAVAELAGVLDLDRNAGELLDQVLADQGRVPAGAAGGEDDAVDRPQLLRREIQAAEDGGRFLAVRAGRAWRRLRSRAARRSP